MKSIIKLFLIYLLCLVIYNCASIGNPSGGPADTVPPFLILDQLSPQSNINIEQRQSIVLPFSERLFPTFINNSIRIEPETEIKIKNLSDKITVTPKDSWPNQFVLYVSRTISDYNNNKLEAPIQLIFSTTDSIVGDTIKGELFNFNLDKNYEVALIDTNYKIISKTESDHNGFYQFLGQKKYSSYFILALENKIQNDFISQIRKNKYGLSNQEINTPIHKLFISPPIPRHDIMNISLVNKKYGKISLSSGAEIDIYFNDQYFRNNGIIKEQNDKYYNQNIIFRDYDFSDSLYLKLNLYNRLEPYSTQKSFLFFEEYNDITLPEIITERISPCNYDSTFSVSYEFSEPIILENGFLKVINIQDSSYFNLGIEKGKIKNSNNPYYYQISENRIAFGNIPISGNRQYFLDCNKIKDLNNNTLCPADSILYISNVPECITEEAEDKKEYEERKKQEEIVIADGEINGIIEYNGPYKLQVVAYKIIDGDERYLISLDGTNIYSRGFYANNKKQKKYLPMVEMQRLTVPDPFLVNDTILIDAPLKNQIDNNNFKLSLQPGEYRIIAYEDINPIGKSYFSGTLEPFKQSAKFIVYNDIIRVRSNWTNTIKMKLD